MIKNYRGQGLIESLLVLILLGSVTFIALGLVSLMVSERWLSKLAYDYLDCLNKKNPKVICFQEVKSRAQKVLPLIVTKIHVQKSEQGNQSTIHAQLLNKKVKGYGFFPKENFRTTSAD